MTTSGACGCGTESEVIACNLSAFSSDERRVYEALLARVMAARTSTNERENGFRFTFSAEPDLAADIARWMIYEQKCCPFFEFELALEANGALSLFIHGPAAAKEIFRAAGRSNAVENRA